MKKHLSLFICIGLLNINSLFSQVNLIQNPSFESYPGPCPTGLGTTFEHLSTNRAKFPSTWETPTNGSTDYFNECNCFQTNSLVCPSGSFEGCLLPHNSNIDPVNNKAYVGLICGGTGQYYPNTREYIQTTLDPTFVPNGLVKGQCYTIEFYVCLANNSQNASNIGLALSKTAIGNYQTSQPIFTDVINFVPQVSAYGVLGHIVTDKITWTKISAQYTALGGEKYVTIGNFEDENSIHKAPALGGFCNSSNLSIPQAYYFVDDVSIKLNVGQGFTPDIIYTASQGNLNLQGNTNTLWSGQNILVDGDLTIGQGATLTIQNSDVRFTKNSKLIVSGGAILYLNPNTTLQAGCSFMWQGIIVNIQGLVISNNIPTSNIFIKDAIEGIRYNSMGAQQILRGINFVKNGIGIYINGGQFSTNSSIENNLFDNQSLLNDPLVGQGGFGTEGIYIKNVTSVNNPVVIGAVHGNGNIFRHWPSGIFLDNSNAVVIGNSFINFVGIRGIGPGTTSQSTPNRFVRVTDGNNFSQVSKAIWLEKGFDATITSNIMDGSGGLAGIQLSQNHNCRITIGSATNPALGNLITGNFQPAISLYDNSSTLDPIINPNSPKRTEIVICRNSISGNNINSWGIGIGEPSQGSIIKYHRMLIQYNTIGTSQNTEAFGISFINMMGYYSIPANHNFLNPNQVSEISSNDIIFDSQNFSTRRGILGNSSNGLYLVSNQVSTFNSLNWQNSGIDLTDCQNSYVRSNFLQAGKGLQVSAYMKNSDLNCNTLNANSVGIQLSSCEMLRASNQTHGTITDSRDNYFNNEPNWGVNMELYNTCPDFNQWIFANGAPSVSYTGACGSSPCTNPNIINSVFGNNACGTPHLESPSGNVSSSLSNPVMQWKDDYYYEVSKLENGQGNSGVASPFIKKLIKIENYIGEADYQHANSLMNGLNPTMPLEQHLKDIYEIFLATHYPVSRPYTTSELNSLNAIAILDPLTEGPGVFTARGILQYELGQVFTDGNKSPVGILGSVAVLAPCSENLSNISIGVIDFDGTIPIIPNAITDAGGNFEFNPYALGSLNQSHQYGFYVVQPSPYAVINPTYQSITSWISQNPISLALTRAKVDTIIVYPVPDTIATADTVALSQGYAVAGTTSQNSGDYYVAQYDVNNQMVWSATYNGMANGPDSAHAVCTDNMENIYITGQVWNGTNFDYVTIKYDPLGNRLWIATYNAPANGNDIATAISTSTNYLNVTGATWNGSSYSFTTISYNQCPGQTNLRVLNNQTPISELKSLCKLYPNPNNGNMTLEYSLPRNSVGEFTIYDLTGRKVASYPLEGGNNTMTVSALNLNGGVYFYKITNGSLVITTDKIVITKE